MRRLTRSPGSSAAALAKEGYENIIARSEIYMEIEYFFEHLLKTIKKPPSTDR
jgi:hypothetical protein